MDSQSLLRKIPLEIFLQVASYLPTRDLGSLRLTCKHAEASLFETFSAEFSTKRQFMLSEKSLQVLISISNHPRLSRCLSHVIIGLDYYDSGRAPPIFREDAQANRYRAGLADQFSLISTGRDWEMLAQAFRNLPNLQTVGMRDYNSGGRVRDNCEWTSYGATTIFEETGVRLIGDPQHATDKQMHFASRVFCTILYALGQSGSKPLTLEILLRTRRLGLRDCAFNIPKFSEFSVRSVLSSFKTLLLGLDVSSNPMFFTIGTNN